MNDKRQTAKRLLRHYVQLLADASAVRLDGDCLSELDWLVDCLVDAAKDELRAEDQDAPPGATP